MGITRTLTRLAAKAAAKFAGDDTVNDFVSDYMTLTGTNTLLLCREKLVEEDGTWYSHVVGFLSRGKTEDSRNFDGEAYDMLKDISAKYQL